MEKIVTAVLAFVICISMFISPANAAELETPSGIRYSDIGKSIEAFVKEREGGLASLEVAVFDGDETLYSGCFGYADVENKASADEQTVYEWASVSKLLTWVSVMQLWERGLLDLDADIRNYLPDGFLTKLSSDEPITMVNLMNHTAGWQETVYDIEAKNESDIVSLEQALRDAEPYQAYAPGEHTAYSNWGAALAGYIVECITGRDFIEYVHESIFAPLGMEHTSIAPDFSDNMWVKKQRDKLRSYCIMQGIYESYGINRSYIMLYPAGSACGTLADFTTFAKGFVSAECPFFEKAGTRDAMLRATSFYGDSDIPMNCHGLWTAEYAVQTIGHGGNTEACSSMLQFDPKSGLGVVIMTNEVCETAFNYGVPGLIFGDYEDSERIKDSVITDTRDISGMYTATRSFPRGFLKFCNVLGAGGFMPVFADKDEGCYDIANQFKLYRVADNQWIQDNGNGVKMFMYETEKDGVRMFETMSTDYVLNRYFWLEAALLIAVLLIAVASAVILLAKLVKLLVRKDHSDKKALANGGSCVTFTQILSVATGVVLWLFIDASSITRPFSVVSCILAALLTLFFIGMAVYCVFRMIKDRKVSARFIIWTLCCGILAAFFIYFEMYNFWLY